MEVVVSILWLGGIILVPSLLLAGASRWACGKESAPWVVLGCWVLMGVLIYSLPVWMGGSLDVGYWLLLLSSTFVTGPLAVVTARRADGWKMSLYACWSLPLFSFGVTAAVLYYFDLIL